MLSGEANIAFATEFVLAKEALDNVSTRTFAAMSTSLPYM